MAYQAGLSLDQVEKEEQLNELELSIACRGSGSPTVVLKTGTGDLGRVWSRAPDGPGRAVSPAVARFTRVCVYDRPGTYLLPGFSRSDPIAMPRTALDIVLDLRALLRAAHVPGSRLEDRRRSFPLSFGTPVVWAYG